MTTRTRYFVIASLLVLFVGVGTGLVAYYAGKPEGFASRPGAMNDLKLLPADAQLVAYADVRDVMDSEIRQRIRNTLPITGQGQRDIIDRTGIDIDKDIDQLLVSMTPPKDGRSALPLVIARGTFETARIEGLMREHGAVIEEYKGARLIVASEAPQPSSSSIIQFQPSPDSFTVAFIEPGMAAIGSRTLVKAAVDQKSNGVGITGNAELMNLVRSFDEGDMWAVGRFDALTSGAILPQGISGQIPAITWFAASAQVDSGIHGMLRADTRDQEAANNLREVLRGFMALGKLQTASHPELKTFLDSLAIGGTGNTVSLSFELPGDVVNLLGTAVGALHPGPQPQPLNPR